MFTIRLDEIIDEGLDLTWEEDRAAVMTHLEKLSDVDFDLETPLRCTGKIRKAGHSIVIEGHVHATLRLQCVRCLGYFSYGLSSPFKVTLLPAREAPAEEEIELKGEEMESSFFEGEEIHLSEIACEQIFLEIPYKPLCDEGCKGLCPVCGRDRNISSCDCAQEQIESGFAVLKHLKL